MIEQRAITYEWQSTAGNSRSLKNSNGVLVGTNYIQNPSASGATAALTPESSGTVTIVTDALTGPGGKSYKYTGPASGTAPTGVIATPAPSVAGNQWWFRTIARLETTVIGARTLVPSLRFFNASGTLLQSIDGDPVKVTPNGVFNRWVGTAGASKSEQFIGDVRRVNEVVNPSFRLNQTGWTVAENFTLSGSDTFTATANADVQSGALVAYTDAYPVTAGDAKSARMDVAVSVTDDAPSQSLQLLIRFYDASGNLLLDSYGTGGDVTDDPTGLILNNALAPAGAVTYRLALVTVDGTPTGIEVAISRALAETGITVGDYFDGDSVDTGTGNWADTFDLSVSAVAPAGTATVRAVVLRIPTFGWEPSSDIFYLDSLLLTISDEPTVPAYFDGDSPDETIFVNVVRQDELTTDEWFEVDGAALNTYAYNISTAGGNRLSPPDVRGANIVVPGRPGTVYMQKELAGQTITLNMWVQGSEATGKQPATHHVIQQFKRNWLMLRKLLFHTRREMVITKRWLDWETDAVISATGKAEYAGGLEPSMTGPARAVFSVDLYMNDPFFYGDAKIIQGSGSVQQKWTEEVPGDWRTTAITATIAGPRVNPRITITTADGDVTWVKYTGTIAQGDTLVLSVDDFTARLNRATGSSTSVIGSVSHGGDKPWLVLGVGQNKVLLESTSGTGSTAISYIPVWF